MSERYPRIRIPNKYGEWATREAVAITLYVHRPGQEATPLSLDAIEKYTRLAGSLIVVHERENGKSFQLDSAGWTRLRNALLTGSSWALSERNLETVARGYRFEYDYTPPDLTRLCFLFPSEYLEEQGPTHMRNVALDLLGPLPICSGSVGLALDVAPELWGKRRQWVGGVCLDSPGLDPLYFTDTMAGGTKIRTPSWMTFVGQPTLGEIGGLEGLRARLHSPGTTVEDVGGDRALITLGEWPEMGDIHKGETLPAYRELAKTLEPWLHLEGLESYAERSFENPADYQRWLRRFLD
jgi:hypothetical protein